MAKKPIDILKTYFETGDVPTQVQFSDLIDSFFHKDSGINIENVAGLSEALQELENLQIGDIEGLQLALSNLANIEITDVSGLQYALNQLTTRQISDITGLTEALQDFNNRISDIQNNFVQKDGAKVLSEINYSVSEKEKVDGALQKDGFIGSARTLDDKINALVIADYAKIVYFNTLEPEDATIFDIVNPPLLNDNELTFDDGNLYISAVDLLTWVFNSNTGNYETKTVINGGSNFVFEGSTTDATNDKAADISRTGRIAAGLATLGGHLVNMTWILSNFFSYVPAKATALVDTDVLVIGDSADALKTKTRTFAQIKATLKTYFDTLYITANINSSNFTKNLSVTDNTLQKVANKVDALNLGAESTAPTVSAIYADIASMIAARSSQSPNAFYKVDDASADPTITSGKAVYQYLGTTSGTLNDYDLIWKLDGNVVSGENLPTEGLDSGLYFRVDKNNRRLLMQYNGAEWDPIRSFGEMKIWVSTLGQDNINFGDGSGIKAFRTIVFAVKQIPPQYYGDVTVIVQAGTYNESVYVNGKNPVGDFKIKFKGEYSSITGTITAITRDTTTGRITITDSSKSFAGSAQKNNFLHITNGINNGCIMPIIQNTTNQMTCPFEEWSYRKDSFSSTQNILFGVCSVGNTYEIMTPTTLINGFIFSKGTLISIETMRFTSSSIAANYGAFIGNAMQFNVLGNADSRFQAQNGASMALNSCSLWSDSPLTSWVLFQVNASNFDMVSCSLTPNTNFSNGALLYWLGSTGVIQGTTLLGKIEIATNSSVGFGWSPSTTSTITTTVVRSSAVAQRLMTVQTIGTKTIESSSFGVGTTE
jgi:hypothetical protein